MSTGTRWYYQEPVYTYYFWKWGNWSDYSDTQPSSGTNREISTRTVYSYNLAALGHNFSVDVTNNYELTNQLLNSTQASGTCYSKGKKCSRCGVMSPDATKIKHSFTKWSDLSSTEKISYCDNGCGCYITKSTSCTHNWVKQSVTEPTCTTKGYTTYKCSLCGAIKKDNVVKALGHENSEEWVLTKEPTCTECGEWTAKCVRWDNGKTCDKVYTKTEGAEAINHKYKTTIPAIAMTCTKDGNTEYTYCPTCDKYFSDQACTKEIKKDSWVIKATGHTAGEWITEHPNGCGVAGWECKYCVNEWCDEKVECTENTSHGTHGALLDEREIKPIDPDYYVFKTEDAAGGPEIEDYVSTTCCRSGKLYITCRNCEGTDHAHGYSEDKGLEYSIVFLDPLNHQFEVSEKKEASCVHEGYVHYRCTTCSTENCDCCNAAANAENEILPAPRTGHQYVLAETIKTECTAGTDMQHYVCVICGQNNDDCEQCVTNKTPHHYWTGDPQKHSIVLDSEHSYPATCTESGLNHYVCTKCAYCYDEILDPLGHDMKLTKTIEPSCLEEGFEVWTCSRCQFTEKRNAKSALGHLTTSPYTVTTKGTCLSDGLEEQFCARVSNGVTCGCKLDEKDIPKRGHNMSEWYEDPASTVTNQLCRKRDCQNTEETAKYAACDYTETEAHLWGPWVYDGADAKTHTKTCQYKDKEKVTESCVFTSEVTKKATCTEDGVRTYTCTVCNGQYTEVIPARRHNWSDWYTTTPATLTTKGEERRECTNTEASSEYEACSCFETRETEVTGANYTVTIHRMDVNGKYVTESSNTYCDTIGKFVKAEYTVGKGFTFNDEKSSTSGVIVRDSSLKLDVYIDRNLHTVSFDDGTGEKIENKYYDAPLTAPKDPEREGYTFKGWSEDGKTVTEVPANVPDRDLEYKAVWEINEYTITWNYDGGKEVETYKYSEAITRFTPPEKEGYSFTGWSPGVPGNMPARNLTFNAGYNINTYVITYMLDGEEYRIEPYVYNSEITKVVPESKVGYYFSGWSPEEPEKMPAKNMTLYGNYVPADGVIYTVYTYVMNLEGEYELDKTEILTGTTGQTVHAVDTTTEGFHINKDKSVLVGTILPDGSLELYIYLNRNIHDISFDDGKEKTSEDLYYGEKITVPEIPEKEGYSFKGWSEDGETPETVLPTVPDRDVEYKAVWEINDYTLYYTYGRVNDGKEYYTTTQNYATAVTAPEDPSAIGYTFTGWSPNVPETMPAANMTLDAQWKNNTYTVTWIVEGTETAVEYKFGDIISIPDDPTFKGKVFMGWNNPIPGTMPARDLEFVAGFKSITHTATFVFADEDGTYSLEYPKTYTEGDKEYRIAGTVSFEEGQSTLSTPVVPEFEGYNGYWEDYTLGETDIVIKAVYELKDTDNTDDPDIKKEAEYNDGGVVTITLDAFSKARNVFVKENTEPLDIVLVVDQSGSMADNLGGKSKREILKETATNFVEMVKENADETGADHRVSIVGFGMSAENSSRENPEYQNTGVLTSKNDKTIKYDNATTDNYRDSLMSVTKDYDHIKSAINRIQSKGATAAELGLEMASQVLTANNSERKKLVLFITDGEPNHSNGFDEDIANKAIWQAKLLKSKGALIYSIAVFDDDNAEDEFIDFLQAVSSNYNNAVSVKKMGIGNENGGYYAMVNDSENLKKMFENIFVRSVARSVSFNALTLYDTVSKEFTMTASQEKAFRESVISKYGVRNSDIIVEKQSDGTTYIEVRNITPIKRFDSNNKMLGWGAEISFDVTANEFATEAGEYDTNTENAGVKADGVAIGTFDIPTITVPETRYILEYVDGDTVYEIKEVSESEFETIKTDSSAEITGRVAKYEVNFGDADRKVTWNIDGVTTTEYYAVGQKIVPPEVNVEGKTFDCWTPDIATFMGNFDLSYTATFGEHVHVWSKKVTGNCEEGRTITYTCDCGETKTETLAACNHELETTIYYTESETISHFECRNCNYSYEKVLRFQSKAVDYDGWSRPGRGTGDLYDLNLYENIEGYEIHSEPKQDYLLVRIPVSSLREDTQRALANHKGITVKHYIGDNNTETEYCEYDYDGEYLIIYCTSFSIYLISANADDDNVTYGEALCMLNGHTYEQKSDESNHWDECTVCGNIINTQTHTDGDRNVHCDICDHDLTETASITLGTDNIALYYKQTDEINAKTTWGKPVYTSSNEKVATVDENGVVTATGRGKCEITVTIEGTDISSKVSVQVRYTWWQWVHWFLFGWIWYFHSFTIGDSLESVPQFLQSLSQALVALVRSWF